MATGILLLLVQGLIWTGIGIVMRSAARGEGKDAGSPVGFFALAMLMTAPASLVFVKWGPLLSGEAPRVWELTAWMGISGVFGAMGAVLMTLAMRLGHQSVSWAMSQSAMIMPFAMSAILWHEQVGALGWTAVAVTLVGIALMARGKAHASDPPAHRLWLPTVIAAFVVVGTDQVLKGVPSKWVGWEDVACLRPTLSFASGALALLPMVCMGHRITRRQVRPAFYWMLLALASYGVLFFLLDLMAKRGLQAVVYPVAIGVCILFFSLYSRLWSKEKIAGVRLVGLVLVLVGISGLVVRTVWG